MKIFESKQFIFFAILIAITISIYLFVPIATQNDKQVAPQNTMGEAESKKQFKSLVSYKQEVISTVSPDLKSRILLLEEEMSSKESNDTALTLIYAKLAAAYADGNAPEIAAYFVSKRAAFANTALAWERSGDNFIALLTDPQTKAALRPALIKETIASFEKASALDPGNLNLKVKLGEGYMEEEEEIMKGVKLMLEVVKVDSNHYLANLMLGKYGIKSGQYEKAIARLEKVISLHSQKLDGYFLLVDAYAASGKNKEAAETLQKVKKHIKDKALLKEIDRAIVDLQNRK